MERVLTQGSLISDMAVGQKLNTWGYAGLSLPFHLPGFHFGPPILDPQPHISNLVLLVINNHIVRDLRVCFWPSSSQPDGLTRSLWMSFKLSVQRELGTAGPLDSLQMLTRCGQDPIGGAVAAWASGLSGCPKECHHPIYISVCYTLQTDAI